jgi:hypothetical protein
MNQNKGCNAKTIQIKVNFSTKSIRQFAAEIMIALVIPKATIKDRMAVLRHQIQSRQILE